MFLNLFALVTCVNNNSGYTHRLEPGVSWTYFNRTAYGFFVNIFKARGRDITVYLQQKIKITLTPTGQEIIIAATEAWMDSVEALRDSLVPPDKNSVLQVP